MCTPVSVTITSTTSTLSAILPQLVAAVILAVGAAVTLLARPVRVTTKKEGT